MLVLKNTDGRERREAIICGAVVALVVMFIFLFLLNIVFQWVAFLRICIPFPKRV